MKEEKKIRITFDNKISSSYIESNTELANKVLKEKALESIKLRFEWLAKLSDKELLEYCRITTTTLSQFLKY